MKEAQRQDHRIKNEVLTRIAAAEDSFVEAREIADRQGWKCSDTELSSWLGLNTKGDVSTSKEVKVVELK